MPSSFSTSTMTQTSDSTASFITLSRTRVINSGHSVYMTDNKDILLFINSNFFHPSVTPTNNFISSVQEIRAFNATSLLSLSSVFYVLKYTFHLLLIELLNP